MVTPYDRAVGALKRLGLWDNGRPKCPCCPPGKRRGFGLLPTTDGDGRPLVLPTCFRGCDRLTELAPALGLEGPEIGGGQTAFPLAGAKFTGTTVEGLKALPRGSARTFEIAAAHGSMWTGGGRDGFASAPIGAVTARVLRTSKQRRAVLREADITPRALEYQVARWIGCRMACRCGDGILTLFRRPEIRCPVCGAPTRESPEILRATDSAGVPASARQIVQGRSQSQVPSRSTSKTVRGEEIRGLLSTRTPHRKRRRNSGVVAKKFGGVPEEWEDRVYGKRPKRSDYPGWGELFPDERRPR